MINKNNIQEFITLDIDNELSPSQHIQLMQYLENDDNAMHDYLQLSATKLLSNTQEKMIDKLSLYAIANQETSHSKKQIFSITKVAASVIVLLFLSVFLKKMFFNPKQIDGNTNLVNTAIEAPTDSTSNGMKTNIAQTKEEKIIENNKLINSTGNEKIVLPKQNTSIAKQHIYKSRNNKISAQNNKIIYKNIPEKNMIQTNIASPIIENETIQLEKINSQTVSLIYAKNNSTFATKIVTKKNIDIPNALSKTTQNKIANTLEFKLNEPAFLENNKAFQFAKKITHTIASIAPEAKNIQENGIELEISNPFNYFKKQH